MYANSGFPTRCPVLASRSSYEMSGTDKDPETEMHRRLALTTLDLMASARQVPKAKTKTLNANANSYAKSVPESVPEEKQKGEFVGLTWFRGGVR
eukprot:2022605-Rhodomonas_salina.1